MSEPRFDLSDPDARAFCPSCGAGFRSGPVRCARCDVALLSRTQAAGRAGAGAQAQDDEGASSAIEDQIWLGDLTTLPAANYLQSSLEEAGIPYLRKTAGALAGPFGTWMNQQTTFMVDPKHLDRARKIFERVTSEEEDLDSITASPAPADTGAGDEGPRCPKCSCGFLVVEVDGTPVRSCEQCGGLWVFETELQQLQNDEISTPTELPPVGTLQGKVGELSCPTCEQKLETVQVSSTQIDRCPACHGIYLDLGELEEVVGPISPSSGGHEVLLRALGIIAAGFGMLGALRGDD